ncbi:MAG: hypothetical protein U9R12_07710 [Candidatus Caldatribacteriota bacterium]|nr:hypothetical protein [Candidatus Caldatribacteriota bacterium]
MNVKRILKGLFYHGYDRWLFIEPHMAVIFYNPSKNSSSQERIENYITYSHRFMQLLGELWLK